MKIPKRFRTYCPSCKTHTEHIAERVKKGKASAMTHIARQKKRQTGIGNSGKFSKVPGGDKPTKRVSLKYRCATCNKSHQRPCFRAKKFEFKE
ncbi:MULTISPECIES: 50S ribosomal protein L44e [Methanococcoides]|jgi:large subunit ribosomal protein L44e|uniref:Large ribosomal subunit protein eL42 n=1 Tax=Methanococcoides seepicolus TaxID=2828780 RepID=A0A9E4ZD63_9EURY|nr:MULTISPECIES: 50S ribosomal protein L44e [Methanococcoides]MCM1986025.1 50S ribosomal protein L44e [Methanococcoides seepicolus]